MAKNEEKIIGSCLDSLQWCDKVIVFDTGSSDQTIKVAKSKGAEVQSIKFNGFGPTRNFILTQIRSEWIVCFDADEICSPELAQEIQRVVRKRKGFVFKARRRNFLFNKEIKYSGWGNDFRHPVLFKKGSLKYDNSMVHEGAVTVHPIKKLTQTFDHYSYRSYEQLMDKEKSYAVLGSQKLLKKNYESSFFKAFVHATYSFIRLYFLRLGIKDGSLGFLIAASNAHSTFYRYMMAIDKGSEDKKSR